MRKALASIWRMRSLVTPNRFPCGGAKVNLHGLVGLLPSYTPEGGQLTAPRISRGLDRAWMTLW